MDKMIEDSFAGLNPEISDAYKGILYKEPKRIKGYLKHIKRGGKFNSYLPLMIGDGYSEFWKTKKRYRVVKGSRSSKKTITTARNFIYNIMKHKGANLLVVRKVGAINKDSTYTELKKAIKDLKVQKYWKTKVNPLEIIYVPTGQKILFRGLTY